MDDKTFIDRAMERFMEDPAAALRVDPTWSVKLQQQAYAMGEEMEKLGADNARLRAALAEIARPKRGGIETNDSDEDWIEYLRRALEREQSTARAALAWCPWCETRLAVNSPRHATDCPAFTPIGEVK